MVESQWRLDAFLLGLGDLLVVGRHPLAGAAVDDHGVGGAQARAVRAASMAVSPPPYTATRRPSSGRSPSSRPCRRETASRTCAAEAAGRYVRVPQLRADGQDDCVPTLVGHRRVQVGDRGVELEGDTEVEQPVDLGVEHLARQPVARDAVAHHPAGVRCGVPDDDLVTEQREVVGRRESGRSGADDEHPPPGGRGSDADASSRAQRLVTEEPLDRVDARPPRRAGRGCRRSRTGGSRPGR